jgi:asparagine synthase (glutamine-hydrolysing)
MTEIAGVVSLAGDHVDDYASGLLKHLDVNRRSSGRLIRAGRAAFAFLGPHEQGRPESADIDIVGLADARLTNRPEIGTLLSFSPNRLAESSDSALLIELYRQFGGRGIARALGAFAFAAWDESAQRLILGRDCLGERPLFFHRGEGFVAFASELKTLLSLPFVPRALDDDTLVNYIAVNLRGPNQTLYRDIERVPSRTLVTIDPSGVRREHYWSPDFAAPPPFKKEADYIERARELFDQAVNRLIRDTPRLAISTSGGLDSSAIAATAARLGCAQSITCYSVVPPEDFAIKPPPNRYSSERSKVEALARMYPALRVQFCEEGALHPFEENPARFFVRSATPHLNPFLLGAFGFLYDRVARDGFSVLQDGRMGNLGLSWTGNYSLLALLRERRFPMLAREFSALSLQSRRGSLRTIMNDFIVPTAPRWLRRLLDRRRGSEPDYISHYSFLNPNLSRELSRNGAWQGEGFDPRSRYSDPEPAKHRAYRLFDLDQFARDTRASSRAIFGFEWRDPHADRTLLEFLLRVPEWMYRQNGVRRSFARKVLADRLPPEILNETKMGVQGVTWFQRMDMRRAVLGEEIEQLAASPLASRLIDVPRMKRILEKWPKDAQSAEDRRQEVRVAFGRGLHVGQFIRWVEGSNA